MHFKSLFVIRRRKEAEDKELLLNYLVTIKEHGFKVFHYNVFTCIIQNGPF